MSAPRFEIVDVGSGFRARFVSGDGNKYGFTSNTFQYRRQALVAIFAFTGQTVRPSNGYPPEWSAFVEGPRRLFEVRDVVEPIRYRPASRRPLPETGAS